MSDHPARLTVPEIRRCDECGQEFLRKWLTTCPECRNKRKVEQRRSYRQGVRTKAPPPPKPVKIIYPGCALEDRMSKAEFLLWRDEDKFMVGTEYWVDGKYGIIT